MKGENAGGAMTGEFYHAIRGFLQAETVAEAIQTLSLGFDGLQKDYGKSLDDVFYADPPFLYLSATATTTPPSTKMSTMRSQPWPPRLRTTAATMGRRTGSASST